MQSVSDVLARLSQYQEFLDRPTAPAHWWSSPSGHVLGGRDLQREEQGTWLGVTKQGRIAVLTNYREEGVVNPEAKSRGAIVNSYLTQPVDSHEPTDRFIERLVLCERLKGVGGFSLVCGKLDEPLAVVSNRTPSVEGISWIADGKNGTVGLSNTAFGDRSWPKVVKGEELLASTITSDAGHSKSEAEFIEDLFLLLSDDSLPRQPKGEGWEAYVKELRKSIFIPVIGGDGVVEASAQDLAAAKSDHCANAKQTSKEAKEDGPGSLYGTQKQTVLLVNHQGRVTFVERTVRDRAGNALAAADRDQHFHFEIEGWKEGESRNGHEQN